MKDKKMRVVIFLLGIVTFVVIFTKLNNYKKNINTNEIEQLKYCVEIIKKENDKISVENLNENLRTNGVMATAMALSNKMIIVFDSGLEVLVDEKGNIQEDLNINLKNTIINEKKILVEFLKENTNKKTLIPNFPELTEEMIPIKWNGTNWIITNKNDKDWFDYSSKNKKWANVMLSDGKYSKIEQEGKVYISDETQGIILKEDELGSMYVWIPRYAYKIEYYINSELIAQSDARGLCYQNGNLINKDNEQGRRISSEDNYIIHPSFLGKGYEEEGGGFGTDEKGVNGIWFAKFEMSIDEKGEMKSLPNKKIETFSYDIQNIKDIILKINKKSTKESDIHIIKNSEWSAVAYLSYSKYGTNGEKIYSNNAFYDDNKRISITGFGGEEKPVVYEYTKKELQYNSINGNKSSTTGNIYGVYDMSGGNSEMVMSGIKSLDFENVVHNLEKKYYTLYELKDIEEEKYGDAIYETYNWDENGADYVNRHQPFFRRGGRYDLGCSGIFNFASWGNNTSDASIRLALIKK